MSFQAILLSLILIFAYAVGDSRSGGKNESHPTTKENRRISLSLNPGCTLNSACLQEDITLINITISDDPQMKSSWLALDSPKPFVRIGEQPERPETLCHPQWLWSVLGHPTVHLALTEENDGAVEINWNGLFGYEALADSILYKAPIYTSTVMLYRLIEYNDTDNTANFTGYAKDMNIYPMDNFTWFRHVMVNTTDRLIVSFVGNFSTSVNAVNLTGVVNITLSSYASSGFGLWLPHLPHSHRTNQVDIQLERLNSTSKFNRTRYAIEAVLVDSTPQDGKFSTKEPISIDDEHTPGVFKSHELLFPGLNSSVGSYLQWRPVVYTSAHRDISEATAVHVTEPEDFPDPPSVPLAKASVYALYGKDLDKVVVKKVFVNFGQPGDGFYKKTKYLSWTFTFGFGSPIENVVSPWVFLTILIFLIVSVVVGAISGIVCIVQKIREKRNAYASLES